MKNIFWLGLLMIILTSCGDDPSETTNDFDRTDLLINLSDNIILPSLNSFKTSATILHNDAITFKANPDLANLENLRTSFRNAYLKWQEANIFEFGPAETIALGANINTFPTNVNFIDSFTNDGIYNLDAINNTIAKGLPAVDYLLFGSAASDQEIVELFSMGDDSENYKKLLSDYTEDILAKIETLYTEWINGYDITFKNNKTNENGSSISIFVNAYILHFESKFRTFKIGLPVGAFSIEGESFPEVSEAYYSGISTDLIKANFEQLKKVYLGGNGQGLDDHLIGVNATELNTTIINQLAIIETNLEKLSESFAQQVANDRATILEVYTEIQRIITLLKADMASALSIQISFSDQDGD